ncbi:interleukin-6-like [Cheilinus undulatus]|uniref:interleukin-6-like n=1 Tax=Cheilinus undulatus TaxID=241271 RepID=UPI001BD3D380|nr:interleukin-6-like [Cheilinus undulatus]
MAALLQSALGAPTEVLPTESLAGDPSGEEVESTSESLSSSDLWGLILSVTNNHSEEFEAEFNNQVKYHMLEDIKIPSLPMSCPISNFSKEACLNRLVNGLFVYNVLLKHVEKEYPNNYKISETRANCGQLVNLIKRNMKHPERVIELPSSQEEQILQDINSPDTFQRKTTAHSILFHLRNFLLQGKRVIRKRENTRGHLAPIFRFSY